MRYIADLLDPVRSRVAPSDESLSAARDRRNAVALMHLAV